MQPDEERRRLTWEWLARSEEDLLAAELLMGLPALRGIGVFHCQQAMEKALQGFLTWHERPFRKTHDLTGLLVQCEQIDGAFGSLSEAANLLSPYASAFRYPGGGEAPTPDQAATAVRLAREATGFVRALLPSRAGPA